MSRNEDKNINKTLKLGQILPLEQQHQKPSKVPNLLLEGEKLLLGKETLGIHLVNAAV